jgi:hypothetical protein
MGFLQCIYNREMVRRMNGGRWVRWRPQWVHLGRPWWLLLGGQLSHMTEESSCCSGLEVSAAPNSSFSSHRRLLTTPPASILLLALQSTLFVHSFLELFLRSITLHSEQATGRTNNHQNMSSSTARATNTVQKKKATSSGLSSSAKR